MISQVQSRDNFLQPGVVWALRSERVMLTLRRLSNIAFNLITNPQSISLSSAQTKPVGSRNSSSIHFAKSMATSKSSGSMAMPEVLQTDSPEFVLGVNLFAAVTSD